MTWCVICISKNKAEVLGSRLQQWNLLEPGTTIRPCIAAMKTLLVIMQVQKI